jgi:hypothetical protein
MANKSLLLRCLMLVAVACATLVAAHYVRHELIEPVAMGAICEKLATWQCRLRDIAILALQQSRLGWGAIALVCVAYFAGSFSVALLAWCVACIGLVLYTPELCALAFLFAGLVAIGAGERDNQVESKAGDAIHSQ